MKIFLLVLVTAACLLSVGCASTDNFDVAIHYGPGPARITIDTNPVTTVVVP